MSSPDDAKPQRSDELVEGEEVVDGEPVDHGSRAYLEARHSRYTSPLPAPDDLRAYAELMPDAAERLLASGESEQRHRHEIERGLLKLEQERTPRHYEGQRRGQNLGFIVAVLYLLVMAGAIVAGYGSAGVTGAAVGVAFMIWSIRRSPDSPTPAPSDEDHLGKS